MKVQWCLWTGSDMRPAVNEFVKKLEERGVELAGVAHYQDVEAFMPLPCIVVGDIPMHIWELVGNSTVRLIPMGHHDDPECLDALIIEDPKSTFCILMSEFFAIRGDMPLNEFVELVAIVSVQESGRFRALMAAQPNPVAAISEYRSNAENAQQKIRDDVVITKRLEGIDEEEVVQ